MIKGLKKFSNIERESKISTAKSIIYDLMVIGGGVTGAGIALDASLRGLKVLLVEKNDFASGTSSKATKLIHGGLRYLKQLEFGLVRETGLERSVAHENAPHLVHPENMFLPIVHDGTFNKLTAGLAISVYDFLAKVPSEDRKVMMDREEALAEEPLLDESKVKSAIVYSEYRTDDARLTLELVKAAVRNSATAFNYMTVTDFSTQKAKLHKVSCKDGHSGNTHEFKAKQIVNSTGPWADKLRLLEDNTSDTNLRLSKGAHLVLPIEKLPISNSIYFDAFDGRMLFAIPRGRVVYVGTTDTNYEGDLDDLKVSQEDVDYILNAVNGFFKDSALTLADVESSWVGLRPLIHQKGKPPTELSRKDEIFVSESGMISIAGGKLTGFRKMAERVVDQVLEELGLPDRDASTKDYKLHHESFQDYKDFEHSLEKVKKKYADYNISDFDLWELYTTYGKDATYILSVAKVDSSHNAEEAELLLLNAQLDYCLEYETLFHPMDFLERRTGWLFFNLPKAQRNLKQVADRIKEKLGLTQSLAQVHLEESKQRIYNNSLAFLRSGSKTDT